MSTTGEEPFRLGDWTVRPRENRVERDGESCTLEPKLLDVLVFLASEPERVHLRQEILDAVWENTFVTEEVLTNAVWELRQALGDDARAPRYIRTVPRKGYGLVAAVEPLADPEPTRIPRRRGVPFVASVALAGIALAGVAAWSWWAASRSPAAGWPGSVAVLPLESADSTPSHRAFAVALTDSLTTEIARSDRYDVPARTRIEELLARGVQPARIAEELGTDAYLEGTLAFAGEGRARLSVQLIERHRDRHIWARIFEDDLTDRLGAERRLARRVALELSRRGNGSRRSIERPPGSAPAPRGTATAAANREEGPRGWRFRTGGEIWADPRRAGDLVLVASDDEHLYALDHRTGEERWRVRGDGPIRDEAAERDGRVFVATCGQLLAVDRTDGRELWRRNLPWVSPPVVVGGGGGMVVGGAFGEGIHALRPGDGSSIWRLSTHGDVHAKPAVVGEKLVATTDAGEVLIVTYATGRADARIQLDSPAVGIAASSEREVFVATDSGYLYRLAIDGTERWRRDLGSRLASAPLAAEGVLYQGTRSGRLLAIDPADGEVLWTVTARDAIGATPRRVGDVLLFGSFDHNLYAVDALSGAERWRVSSDGWIAARPLVVDDRVVFAGIDGVVRSVPLEQPVRPARTEPAWPDPGEPRLVTASGTPGPRLLWRSELDTASRLAPGNGKLVVATASGISALESETGELLWRFPVAGGVVARPTLSAGRVLFGSWGGRFFSLAEEDGREVWRRELGAGTLSAAAVDDGVIYLGDRDGRVHALDFASGAPLWSATTGLFVNSSPLPLQDRIIVGSCDEHVWAFDRRNGEVLWTSHAGECVVSDPVLFRDLVVFGSSAGDILALDVESGARSWTTATGGEDIWYRPLLLGDRLFVGSGDYHLYALRADDGAEIWRFPTGNRTLSEIGRYGDSLLFGSHDRRLYAVDRRTGRELWHLETTRPVENLEVAGATLYLIADNRYVLAYRLPG